MASKETKKSFRGSLSKSFFFALEGFMYVLKNERNIKIHIIIAIFMILLSLYLNISKIEWVVLFLIIGGMVVIEIINTAIENVVDLVTEEFHPLAKIAKDVAASAALVFAVVAVVVGIILYLPYIVQLVK
ncbi:diacylglycerol kinase [Sutcliffiella cohnii]|uniref:Diacylglycerol kinase n=1 Tax=Sutcliffiella cohnii TaxID=33932 RepID=A0A223KTE2_9BACI|nr:diacylglycerol kinase family protein [Sutcliffiella cohnii]AST92614.1 diacylglycerol kinase [Sutcliffiella cohnii]